MREPFENGSRGSASFAGSRNKAMGAAPSLLNSEGASSPGAPSNCGSGDPT